MDDILKKEFQKKLNFYSELMKKLEKRFLEESEKDEYAKERFKSAARAYEDAHKSFKRHILDSWVLKEVLKDKD